MRTVQGVASIVDEMRENRLRWLGHVLRRQEGKAMRSVKEIYVEERKWRPEKKTVGCD